MPYLLPHYRDLAQCPKCCHFATPFYKLVVINGVADIFIDGCVTLLTTEYFVPHNDFNRRIFGSCGSAMRCVNFIALEVANAV